VGDILTTLAVFAAYIILMRYVLPKAGVHT
jgi:hypothetical protein